MNTETKVTTGATEITGATATTHDIELTDEVLEQIIRESRNSDGTLEFARRIARAAIEADRKKFGRNDNDRGNDNDHCKRRGSIVYNASASSEPVAKVRDRGFEVVDGKHVPTVLVEFPVDDWESRDRFAAAVDAPQPAEQVKMRPETDSEHIARDIREGRFPEKSDKKMVPAEPDKQHPDDVAVDAFAAAMKAKLKRAREEKGRGGWQDMSATELSAMLREHVEKGDPVDVANLAMMLHQNGQGITPAEPVACPICSEDEAHSGTCGSNDPRALCKALDIEGFCLHEAHREHKHKTGEDCTCPKYIRHPSCVQHEVRKYLPSKNPWGGSTTRRAAEHAE